MQTAGGSRRIAVTVLIAVACCRCVSALNPSLAINQYAHNAWTIREGFFKAPINTIAQTTDGYIWLGADSGLLRFDGIRATEWTPPHGEQLPNNSITKLYGARDGTLWIGTFTGLASWNGGRLVRYPEFDGYRVFALLEDHEGTVWVGSGGRPNGSLCAIQAAKVRCDGGDGRFGSMVFSMHEDSARNLWVAGSSGVWRWSPGTPEQIGMPHTAHAGSAMVIAEGSEGKLLVATGSEVLQVVRGKGEPFPIPGKPDSALPIRLLRDRDGGLWIGTIKGLFHTYGGRVDAFARPAGLSGDVVLEVLEDREGNVWVLTSEGLDRFREFAVSTVSIEQGLSSQALLSVLAAQDGSVWAGSPDGLNRWEDGRVTVYHKANGLPDDSARSLLQDSDGTIWTVTPGGLVPFKEGVFGAPVSIPKTQYPPVSAGAEGGFWITGDEALVRLEGGRITQQFPWRQLGTKQFAGRMIASREPGGLWLGFTPATVAYFKDGRIRQWYASKDGLGEGRVRGLMLDSDGALWVATDAGLSLIRQGRITTLNNGNGLPCDLVEWSMDDEYGSTWLYTGCGLVRLPRTELDAWKADPKSAVHPVLFESSDGIVGAAKPMFGSGPRVTKAGDGRLWFLSALSTLSVIDPRHIPINKIPPPVHIEHVIADHNLASDLRLPPRTRDLEIDYTALSFVASERNRFKYKLEGRDAGWVDAGTRRQAFYTDLRPRKYRFHVIACNNSGVWNETGDTLEFSIDPAWNQTTWFYTSCVAAFLAMLWGLYRLRLYQIRREFNAQLDGRVDERLRVARELHDTMLQSFQAALIQMQAAYNIFARRPEKTGESLEKAINTAAGAIAEGRSAIQDLRLHPAGGGDLAQLITTAGQELARSEEASANPPVFGVTVEGARRDVAPLIQDEVYRIARELLRNAFRHAQAGRIEVEIRYDSRQFRLHVRDDGKGIGSEVLKAGGRAGHYGLPGMRERANRFGGKLDFWSEAGAGTEAVLTVPGGVAYGGPNGGRFAFLRRKLWIHER